MKEKIETEVKYARENARLNKQGTMRAIQRKKRYDKKLQQIDETIASLESKREALEDAYSAKGAVKRSADLNLDDVHGMMDVLYDGCHIR